MPEVQVRRTFGIGEGTIGPDSIIERGLASLEEINEFGERLRAGEFTEYVEPECADTIAEGCVDGRGMDLIASAAGGPTTYVMADALTDQRYRKPGEKITEHAKRVFTTLLRLGHKISNHVDDKNSQAHGQNCGCGAQDKIDPQDQSQPSILSYVHRRTQDINGFLSELGAPLTPRVAELVPQRAQQLHDEQYAVPGKELSNATKEIGGEDSIKVLEGEHNEAFVVVITDPRLRINRQKIYAAYGGRLQVFVLNVPAIVKGSAELSASDDEASVLTEGGLVYNTATTAVLAGPDLGVIVL